MDNEERNPTLLQADSAYTAGRLDEALRLYTEALALEPALAWAHSRVGAILAQQGDKEGAEDALSRAIALDPNLPQAHSNLGNLYYARGDYEQAVAKYKSAIALDPSAALYHENLHAAYKKMGKLSEAVGELKQAHRLEREGAKADVKHRFQNARKGLTRRSGCLTFVVLLIIVAVVGMVISYV